MTDKTKLIKQILNGEKGSRVPYSFWTHFPSIDLDAKSLAETTYAFYKDLDLDMIKTMPNGMYTAQDWGCECDFSQIATGGVARVTQLAVVNPEDWLTLESLDIEKGSMGRELESLRLLLGLVNNEAPVIATVFSPLTTAHKLSNGKVLEHLKSHPDMVARGLSIITETTCRFAKKAVDLGCAGIFLANQTCTEEMMTSNGFARHCKPYDVEVLKAVQPEGWCNLIHVHGNRILFDQVYDYPVQGVSYHVWETSPEIDEFLRHTKTKILLGGLQRMNITHFRLISLIEDLKKTLHMTGGRRLILAPGCTIRYPVEKWMLKAIIAGLREFEEMQGLALTSEEMAPIE